MKLITAVAIVTAWQPICIFMVTVLLGYYIDRCVIASKNIMLMLLSIMLSL